MSAALPCRCPGPVLGSGPLPGKILADQQPSPPTRALFEAVEFEGLQATPYVTDRGRMAYSLRATGIKAVRSADGKDAA